MIKTVWSVTFQVSNLERAAKFYEEVLGLQKKYVYSSYVGFDCGGVEIGLTPKARKRQKSGFCSPSVEFLVDDVKSTCEQLKRKGVVFTEELHEESWGGREAAFLYPDGNVLEIVQINWKKYFDGSASGAQTSRD